MKISVKDHGDVYKCFLCYACKQMNPHVNKTHENWLVENFTR